jgi:hypothetical protein
VTVLDDRNTDEAGAAGEDPEPGETAGAVDEPAATGHTAAGEAAR